MGGLEKADSGNAGVSGRPIHEIADYDELLVRWLIGKVTVYDDWFEVEFKSGMAVDVER